MGHNGAVFDNVIVPFDGSPPGRAALAPAGDLAWRCGGRLVVVSNTDANDQASRAALKQRAMSMSGADVDFWVDPGRSMGEALVRSAANRADPLICLPLRSSKKGLFRKVVPEHLPSEVLRDSTAPLMVIGPHADVSRGLPLSELVVPLDGSPENERVLPEAIRWARTLKAGIVLLRVVPPGTDDHRPLLAYLSEQLSVVSGSVPEARFELVEASDPASAIVAFLGDRDNSVVLLPLESASNGDRVSELAAAVVDRSPRAVVLVRP